MNREDTIRMAQEAGFCHDLNNGIYLSAPKHIEHFAALVAAAEREALCKWIETEFASYERADRIVEAIRARGQV